MLQVDGIAPRLGGEVCEALLCQQYWQQGRLVQEVDALFIKVRGRWHRLYFEAGIVFWRVDEAAPVARDTRPDDPFVYPLLDVAAKYALNGCLITDCVMEPHVAGARIAIGFESRGTLLLLHSGNTTGLRFVESTWAL